jgi:hypothetical protein
MAGRSISKSKIVSLQTPICYSSVCAAISSANKSGGIAEQDPVNHNVFLSWETGPASNIEFLVSLKPTTLGKTVLTVVATGHNSVEGELLDKAARGLLDWLLDTISNPSSEQAEKVRTTIPLASSARRQTAVTGKIPASPSSVDQTPTSLDLPSTPAPKPPENLTNEATSEKKQIDPSLGCLVIMGTGLAIASSVYIPLFFVAMQPSCLGVGLMLLVQAMFLIPLYVASSRPVNAVQEHRRRFAGERQRHKNLVSRLKADYQAKLRRYQTELAQNRTHSLAELQTMHHRDFEEHVAHIFQKMGYQTSIQGGTGDRGVDIEARTPTEHAIIQCKRYGPNNKVGSPNIRNFVGAMTLSGAPKGYFVTSGKFSKPAIEEADRVESLVLIDGEKIVSLWKDLEIGPYARSKPPTPPKHPASPVYTPPPPYPEIKVYRFSVRQWLALMALAEVNLAVINILFILL